MKPRHEPGPPMTLANMREFEQKPSDGGGLQLLVNPHLSCL